MADCPCCSGLAYEECCAPYLDGKNIAPTAEALMRSRYSAYATGNIDHIRRTMHRSARSQFDEESARNWSTQSEWLGLEIVSAKGGGPDDTEGSVEFVARYKRVSAEETHHEIAQFKRENGKWYFVSGKIAGQTTFVRANPKIGRNEPCTCGSGRKFKKCCGK
jgi:SEC-C motif-containing protein